jgi:hypothetical protein
MQERLESSGVELLLGLHSNGRLLVRLENIGQGWKLVAVENTLACYDCKKFLSTDPEQAKLHLAL